MGQQRLDRVPRREGIARELEKGTGLSETAGSPPVRRLLGTSTPGGEPRGRGGPGRCRQAPGRLLPLHAPDQSADVLQDVGRPREPSPGPRRARPGRVRGSRNPGHGHGGLQTHRPATCALGSAEQAAGAARLWAGLSVGFPSLALVQSPGRFQHLATPCSAGRQPPLAAGILQARILEWAAMPSSTGSSRPRDPRQVSCFAGGFFIVWTTWEGFTLPRYSLIWKLSKRRYWGYGSFLQWAQWVISSIFIPSLLSGEVGRRLENFKLLSVMWFFLVTSPHPGAI